MTQMQRYMRHSDYPEAKPTPGRIDKTRFFLLKKHSYLGLTRLTARDKSCTDTRNQHVTALLLIQYIDWMGDVGHTPT